ncbi:MAG: glycosyltransferase family 2 protein [Candidatus Buchananbacteria bacterium]
MKVFVVIAAYNEEQTIKQVAAEVRNQGYQVLVVDDGSTDQTAKLASEAGAVVLSHSFNRGQGAALQTGIVYALNQKAEIIVTFDGDGQFLAEEIKTVIKPIVDGKVQVVLGSRFLKPGGTVPRKKEMILRLATWVTNLYTGLKLTDIHNGFRAFSRQAAFGLDIRQDGMAHASEILEQIKRFNFKYQEVPVTVKYTEYSLKKGQKLSNSFRIILDLLISRISQ